MSDEAVTHFEGPDGLFGTVALCGADLDTTPLLRQSQVIAAINCIICLDMLYLDALKPTPLPAWLQENPELKRPWWRRLISKRTKP